MKSTRRTVLIAAAALLFAGAASAGVSPAEQARIDRLIEYIHTHKDVTFVRNGKDYSCEDAAKFMRGKMKAMGEHVSTAQQFIEQIASKSSTSGQPYMVRFADGKTLPVAKFLGDELSRMDGKN
jgi:ABC-type sugar transport system substrate-binding protein